MKKIDLGQTIGILASLGVVVGIVFLGFASTDPFLSVDSCEGCATANAQNSGSDASTENTSGTGDVAYTDPDGRRGTYNGQLQNGTPHGQGRVDYDDGSTFVGSFVAGGRSGQGTLISLDRGRYDGEWRDDRPNGHGTAPTPAGTT